MFSFKFFYPSGIDFWVRLYWHLMFGHFSCSRHIFVALQTNKYCKASLSCPFILLDLELWLFGEGFGSYFSASRELIHLSVFPVSSVLAGQCKQKSCL